MQSSDRSAAAIAARQYGVVTRAQALAAGLTRYQIEHRVKVGRWTVVARGVYVVRGSPATWLQATLVACLAGPPGTLASHVSAAALYGLCRPPAEPHVMVPLPASGRFRGATVHRTDFETLIPCRAQGIPVTHPARTILDCASVVGLDALCALVDDAFCRKLTSPAAVRTAVFQAGRSGRRGVAALEQAMEVWGPGAGPETPAEARLLRRLKDWGLPVPERQYVIRDEAGRFVARVDFAWPRAKVVLEYDGERHHGPRRWLLDDERQIRVESLGWRVERSDRDDLRPSATRLPAILRPALVILRSA